MKVAVITGAASGIGLALSRVNLQNGIRVFMVDKDLGKLENEAQQLLTDFPEQVIVHRCDVTQSQEVEHLFQLIAAQVDHVDFVYNNAGIIGNLAPLWELEYEEISRVMDVNLYGMIHMIRAFMPLLITQHQPAHIINMASLYALSSGSQMAAYSMSKHAVLALSESLYFDLQRLAIPINVSVVFPSFTDTALLSPAASTVNSLFQDSLNNLLSHSRPALEVAQHIVSEVEQKRFYILPDKEVKGYAEERTHAIVMQENPHLNNVEKLMISLIKRKRTQS